MVNIFKGISSHDLWKPQKDTKRNKTKPIPEDVFNKILYHAIHDEKDVLTKAGIIIQSQTGLRINEVLSICEACVKTTSDGYDYMEVELSKTEKAGEMMHRSGKVSANDIEMVLFARKTKTLQYYVPKGATYARDSENNYNVTGRYSLSPAIRQHYLYICVDTGSGELLRDSDNNVIKKWGVYWFDVENDTYALFDQNDASMVSYLGEEYYEHCLKVINNLQDYYPKSYF